MRQIVLLLALLAAWTASLSAEPRPNVSASAAKDYDKKFATVFGRVIEVRRVFKGPVIFEIEGRPAAPAFRALVYPLAVERFGSDPEKVYLGQVVEVTGPVIVRKDLPQMWINDPSAIQLKKPGP
jgi:hypothetical protein